MLGRLRYWLAGVTLRLGLRLFGVHPSRAAIFTAASWSPTAAGLWAAVAVRLGPPLPSDAVVFMDAPAMEAYQARLRDLDREDSGWTFPDDCKPRIGDNDTDPRGDDATTSDLDRPPGGRAVGRAGEADPRRGQPPATPSTQ